MEELTANAELVHTALNSFYKLNPSNPQAVAQNIEKMVKALKVLLPREIEHLKNRGENPDCYTTVVNARLVLSQIEKKE
jgi:hypothetical protein